MDPLFKGAYPADVLEHLGADAPKVQAGDLQHIATPMDFLGVNYYTRSMISAGAPWDVHNGGREVTEMGWEVYPEGLTDLLLRLHRDYALPPMYVKENGAAFKDMLVDGQVHDSQRTNYIANHIAAVGDALAHGVRMEGYMVWSLLDNFEWASGYEKRFGIVHVDYATQHRTLKDSALWYRGFLQRQKARARTAQRGHNGSLKWDRYRCGVSARATARSMSSKASTSRWPMANSWSSSAPRAAASRPRCA